MDSNAITVFAIFFSLLTIVICFALTVLMPLFARAKRPGNRNKRKQTDE